MKKCFPIGLVIIAMIITSSAFSCLWAQETQETEEKEETTAVPEAYIISAGDILEIITWKEPDLSREDILVRTDGKITFPLLDDLQAAGMTPVQLKGDIEKGLSEFVDGPLVTVTVSNPGSQKFYILGEVAKTGEYALYKQLTVLQAFALAGGFTEWASKSEIILLRREDGQDRMMRIDYKDIVKGKGLEQNIRIQKDDIIIVP